MRYAGAKKQLTGKIIVSNVTSNKGDHVSIRIEDNASGIIVAELEMSHEQFGKMLASSTNADCQIDYYPSDNIGKRLEVKREIVPEINYDTTRNGNFVQAYTEAVSSYEVDGWKADTERGFNSHRRVGSGYEVIFRRYV